MFKYLIVYISGLLILTACKGHIVLTIVILIFRYLFSKWNNYLVLNNRYYIGLRNYYNNDQQLKRHDFLIKFSLITCYINCVTTTYILNVHVCQIEFVIWQRNTGLLCYISTNNKTMYPNHILELKTRNHIYCKYI